MKTLYIVRHAKSSWEDPSLTDIERPLLEKGIKKTSRVLDFLLTKDLSVDVIISSPAVRAHETAKLLAPSFCCDTKDIVIDDRLYEHPAEEITEVLYELDDKINSAMIVGHNPVFTDLANNFLDTKIDWLPTSGVVCIEFHTDKWQKISLTKKSISFIVYPGMLKKV